MVMKSAPDGGTEPIGNRIIVLPEDPLRAELRDPKSGFIDYVPVGSIKKGEALATTLTSRHTGSSKARKAGWTQDSASLASRLAGGIPRK